MAPSEYAELDGRLLTRDWTMLSPAGWPSLREGRPQEECLETLLILSLSRVVGEPLEFLFRGGDHWNIQDVSAIDALGRIHIFELKRDRIDGSVTRQLGHYLLRAMYDDGAAYARRLASLGDTGLTRERWEFYLAACLANVRSANSGRKFVNGVRGKGGKLEIEAADWRRLDASGRWAELGPALLATARARGGEPLRPEALRSWAADVHAATQPTLPPPLPFRVRRSGVVWLVGRSFTEEALRDVRDWRRAGVDARVLELEARQGKGGRWYLRVRREDFPERAALLGDVASSVATLPKYVFREDPQRPHGFELDLEFYSTAAPSASGASGGLALGRGARAVLYRHDREAPERVWTSS